MGSSADGDAASHQDASVKQLLEEPQGRLQPQLWQDSGTWLLTEGWQPGGTQCVSSGLSPRGRWAQDVPRQSPQASSREGPVTPAAQGQADGHSAAGDACAASEQQRPRPPAEPSLTAALWRRPSPLRSRSASREARPGPKPTDGGSGRPAARAAGRAGETAREHRPLSAPPARGRGQLHGAPVAHERAGGFEGRLLGWERRHKAFKARQQQARQEKETWEMEQCTFRPAINSRSEVFARRARACCAEPLAERLHREGEKKIHLRHKARELLEADELYSHSFHPQVNKSRASTLGRTPIHLRAEEVRLKKEEHHRTLRSAEGARSQCSFRPQISERSTRIVHRKRERLHTPSGRHSEGSLGAPQPVEERLYAGALAAQERREALQDSLSEPPLAPSVDETSRRICRESVYFQGAQQDFLTRQQTFELARRKRAETRSRHAEAECSFAPKISEHSRQLVSLNVKFVGETVEEKVDRLAVQDAARRERLQGALEQLQYRDCTFQPSLSPTSHALATAARDRDGAADEPSPDAVHERLYRSAFARPTCGEGTPQPDSECSFRPQLDQRSAKRYAHVKPHYACGRSCVMDSIKDDLLKKEEHLAELRQERDKENQAECTFAPEPGRIYEEPRRPVPVSGLGRFFELRELAHKQQQDREDRENRAFHPEMAVTDPRFNGVTIPEPFELSRRPLKERLATGSHECTFVPRTSEAASRELLKKLLQPALSKEVAARPPCV